MEPKLSRGTLLGSNGRYQVERWLSQGRFGQTYRAYDRRLGHTVVVKRLKHDPNWNSDAQHQAQQHFKAEAHLLLQLNFPGFHGIPEIYDYLEDEACLVLRYIEGQTLFTLVNAQPEGRLATNDALRYIRDACAALVYMHLHTPNPILHRDIKPDNIIRDLRGRAWLIDFGISHAFQSSDTFRTAIPTAGTRGYMPPEQERGQAEPRSDVYALAATLYTLITGEEVGVRENRWELVVQGQIAVQPEVMALVDAGLSVDVNERPDAQSFLAALDSMIEHCPISLPPPRFPLPQPAGLVWRPDRVRQIIDQVQTHHRALLTGISGTGKRMFMAEIAQHWPTSQIFWYRCDRGSGFDLLVSELALFLAHHGSPELWHQFQMTEESKNLPLPPDLINTYLIEHIINHGYLLCLDDLDLLDLGDLRSKQLLVNLVHKATQGQVTILASARGMLTEFAAEASIRLDANPVVDGRQFLQIHAPGLAPTQIERLHRAVGDNLFSLKQAIAACKRGADLETMLAQLATPQPISLTLVRVIDGLLHQHERLVIHALVLLPDRYSRATILAAMINNPQLDLAAILTNLETLDLLERRESPLGPAYTLHAAVQDLYADQIMLRRRLLWNRWAAEYYRTDEPDPMRAALHYLVAGAITKAIGLIMSEIDSLLSQGYAPLLARLIDRLEAHPPRLEPSQWVQLLIVRGELYARADNSEAALNALRAAHEQMDALPASEDLWRWKIRICRDFANLLEYTDPRQALHWIDNGLELSNGQSVADEAALHIRAGSIYIGNNVHDKGLTHLHRAMPLAPEDEQPHLRNTQIPLQLRIKALNNFGIAYCKLGDMERGVGYYQAALKLARDTHDMWQMVAIRHNFSISREDAGDWHGALADYHEVLGLAQQYGSVSTQVQIELSIALQEMARGQTARAEERFEHLLERTCTCALHEHQIYILTSYADLALRLKRYAQARNLFSQAQTLSVEIEVDGQLSEIERGYAQIWLAQGDSSMAHSAAEAALAFAIEQESPLDEAESRRVLARVHYMSGDHAAAWNAFAQSRAILAEHHFTYPLARTCLWYGQALVAAGDTDAGQRLCAEAHASLATLGADPAMA